MSLDPFSEFIKKTRLYFPQGHPIRSVANTISTIDTIGKYQYLRNTRAQLQYQLDKVAYWERIFPRINYSQYKEKLMRQLTECDEQRNLLEKEIISDEAKVSASDKLRIG